MNNHPRKTKCWPLKHTAKLMQGWPLRKHRWKIKVISEKIWNENLRVDYLQKSTRSSGATPIGCTFAAPNELQSSTVQNADLWSMNQRQNTKFRGIIVEEDSKISFLLDHSEFRGSDLTGLLSRHFLLKSKTTSWTLDLWADYFKINPKIGGLWGTDIPRVHQKDKMPRKGPVGPIIRKVIPSWAWGGTANKPDRRKPRRSEEFKRRSQQWPDLPAQGPRTSELSEDESAEL
jgi:hypothetical protein